VILADTSVWIDHLRHGNQRLGQLLDDAQIAVHPFVIGELAYGTLRARGEILALLGRLPAVPAVSHEEALHTTARYDRRGERAKRSAADLLRVPARQVAHLKSGRVARRAYCRPPAPSPVRFRGP
jgi:predicted nucleic acid-binding protein